MEDYLVKNPKNSFFDALLKVNDVDAWGISTYEIILFFVPWFLHVSITRLHLYSRAAKAFITQFVVTYEETMEGGLRHRDWQIWSRFFLSFVLSRRLIFHVIFHSIQAFNLCHCATIGAKNHPSKPLAESNQNVGQTSPFMEKILIRFHNLNQNINYSQKAENKLKSCYKLDEPKNLLCRTTIKQYLAIKPYVWYS